MQRQMFNGFHGNHTAVTQNATSMMLVHHGNQEQNGGQPMEGHQHNGTMGRPSPIQHTTAAIKHEATG
jgi:hypothetical protein